MITITIKTDNAAFEDHPDEVARILRRLADQIQGGQMPDRLYDVNGNKVGEVRLTGKDRA